MAYWHNSPSLGTRLLFMSWRWSSCDRPVVNAPSYGAILSGERLNAPREKDLLSSRRRKLDYLSGHKDDQTAYMTKHALAVGWLKVRTFSWPLSWWCGPCCPFSALPLGGWGFIAVVFLPRVKLTSERPRLISWGEGLAGLPRVFCFLGVSLSLVFASPSRLLCPPLY